MTAEERLAIVETKLERLPEMERKLDNLLALRNKGTGAFLLASALFGTGIIGFLAQIFGWFRT